MDTATIPTRLVLRLPPDLHAALQIRAKEHERSLNGEIVYALRRYAEGAAEFQYIWGDDEQIAREWMAGAGNTLTDDGDWAFTEDEREEVQRLLARR